MRSTATHKRRQVQPLCDAAHLCLELHLRRLKRVVRREVDVNEEHAARIRAVARSHNSCLRMRATNQCCQPLVPLSQTSAGALGVHFTAPRRPGDSAVGRPEENTLASKPKASRLDLPVEEVVTGRAGTARGRRILLQVLGPQAAAAWSPARARAALNNSQATNSVAIQAKLPTQQPRFYTPGSRSRCANSAARFAPTDHVSNTPGQTCSSFDMRFDAIRAAPWPQAPPPGLPGANNPAAALPPRRPASSAQRLAAVRTRGRGGWCGLGGCVRSFSFAVWQSVQEAPQGC